MTAKEWAVWTPLGPTAIEYQRKAMVRDLADMEYWAARYKDLALRANRHRRRLRRALTEAANVVRANGFPRFADLLIAHLEEKP